MVCADSGDSAEAIDAVEAVFLWKLSTYFYVLSSDVLAHLDLVISCATNSTAEN